MDENFRPLSDLPECSSKEEDIINDDKKKWEDISVYRFELWKITDIYDRDLQKEVQRNNACKDSFDQRLYLLEEISNHENEFEDILEKNNRILKTINTTIEWHDTYPIKEGDTLSEIIADEYGLDNWPDIAKKMQLVLKYNNENWNRLNLKIITWKNILLPIMDSDSYVSKKINKGYEKRSIVIKKIEDKHDAVNTNIENKNSKIPSLIKAELTWELENWLDNNKYSWELNSNAYEIYQNLRNTRWEQIIWTYRNKDWEEKNIVLWDNHGENIYMELDESYRWDDISEDKIDDIESFDDLKEVMKKLLKKYEQEVIEK